MEEVETVAMSANMPSLPSSVFLLTATVPVSGSETDPQLKATVFMDTGSQRTFISERLAERLKLKKEEKEVLRINTFGSKKTMVITSSVNHIHLRLRDGHTFEVRVNTVPVVTHSITKSPLGWLDTSFIQKMVSDGKVALADKMQTKESRVHPDILIGQDYYHQLVGEGMKIQLPSAGLYLIPSKFGYLVGGRTAPHTTGQSAHVGCVTLQEDSHEESKLPDLDDLWRLECENVNVRMCTSI